MSVESAELPLSWRNQKHTRRFRQTLAVTESKGLCFRVKSWDKKMETTICRDTKIGILKTKMQTTMYWDYIGAI